jgi:hypothetical protein
MQYVLDFPYLHSISATIVLLLCYHEHIYHVLSSRNINKRQKRTQEIYLGKTPGKTQQPFLDRFHSQRKSN